MDAKFRHAKIWRSDEQRHELFELRTSKLETKGFKLEEQCQISLYFC